MSDPNTSADELNRAAAAAGPVVEAVEGAVSAVDKSAGSVLSDALSKVEDLAVRVATIEESLSPILHLLPGVGAIAGMADELASIVENLKRGRVAT